MPPPPKDLSECLTISLTKILSSLCFLKSWIISSLFLACLKREKEVGESFDFIIKLCVHGRRDGCFSIFLLVFWGRNKQLFSMIDLYFSSVQFSFIPEVLLYKINSISIANGRNFSCPYNNSFHWFYYMNHAKSLIYVLYHFLMIS